jgi:hypothetical protein
MWLKEGATKAKPLVPSDGSLPLERVKHGDFDHAELLGLDAPPTPWPPRRADPEQSYQSVVSPVSSEQLPLRNQVAARATIVDCVPESVEEGDARIVYCPIEN